MNSSFYYYNLLFIAPLASAKTLFSLGILDMKKDSKSLGKTVSNH
jgi:hypothetical protein